jgi:UrcA family protein
MLKSVFPAVVATLVSCACATPLFAEDSATTVTASREVNQASVKYNDLNLASAEGVSTLNRRVRRAAKMLCTTNSSSALELFGLVRECVSDAISGAQPQVDVAIARFGNQDVAMAEPIRVTLK